MPMVRVSNGGTSSWAANFVGYSITSSATASYTEPKVPISKGFKSVAVKVTWNYVYGQGDNALKLYGDNTFIQNLVHDTDSGGGYWSQTITLNPSSYNFLIVKNWNSQGSCVISVTYNTVA